MMDARDVFCTMWGIVFGWFIALVITWEGGELLREKNAMMKLCLEKYEYCEAKVISIPLQPQKEYVYNPETQLLDLQDKRSK